MATKNSDLYAVQIAPTLRSRNNPVRENASLRFIEALYTMLGTEAQNDLINIAVGLQGMVIDPSHSTVVSEGIATTATLDVGDTDLLGVGTAVDIDRYADGLDIAAAGVDRFDANACAARLTPYTLGSDCIIQGKFITLVTPVAGKKLRFRIGYLIAG
jgi:hypothetical protein